MIRIERDGKSPHTTNKMYKDLTIINGALNKGRKAPNYFDNYCKF